MRRRLLRYTLRCSVEQGKNHFTQRRKETTKAQMVIFLYAFVVSLRLCVKKALFGAPLDCICSIQGGCQNGK
jgi:hypothetical protein